MLATIILVPIYQCMDINNEEASRERSLEAYDRGVEDGKQEARDNERKAKRRWR